MLVCVCVLMQIIVANPKTAGVARWIFLALWGSKMKKGDAAATEYVTKVSSHNFEVPSLAGKLDGTHPTVDANQLHRLDSMLCPTRQGRKPELLSTQLPSGLLVRLLPALVLLYTTAASAASLCCQVTTQQGLNASLSLQMRPVWHRQRQAGMRPLLLVAWEP